MRTLDCNDIVRLEELGEGGFGKVIKAYSKPLGKFIAIKYIMNNGKYDEFQMKNLIFFEHFALKEIEKIKSLHPENSSFFNYYGIRKEEINPTDKNCVKYIFLMESGYCTLKNLVEGGGEKYKYTPQEILYILAHLVECFALLQEHGVYHSDIKPDNIVFTIENGDPVYKTMDFGMSIFLPKNTEFISTLTLKGFTRTYLAPEIKKAKELGKTIYYNPYKADVYSLGITILQILKNVDYKQNQKLSDILETMTIEEPSKRPDFIQLRTYFRGNKEILMEKPANEWKKYELFFNKKGKNNESTEKGIIESYKKHFSLQIKYQDIPQNTDKMHLDKCLSLLKKYEEKIKNSSNPQCDFSVSEEREKISNLKSSYIKRTKYLETTSSSRKESNSNEKGNKSEKLTVKNYFLCKGLLSLLIII